MVWNALPAIIAPLGSRQRPDLPPSADEVPCECSLYAVDFQFQGNGANGMSGSRPYMEGTASDMKRGIVLQTSGNRDGIQNGETILTVIVII